MKMGLLKCCFIVCSCYLFTKSYQKYVFVFFIHVTLLGLPNNQPVAIFFSAVATLIIIS